MKINCENCGKCCFSEIPTSFYTNKQFFDNKEIKNNERANKIVLTIEEIKAFWNNNLGIIFKMCSLVGKDRVTLITLTIRNIPKLIDNKWVLACSFLDPLNKKCRIYNTNIFPSACKTYPYDIIMQGFSPLCERSRLISKPDKKGFDRIVDEIKKQSNSFINNIHIEEDIISFQNRMMKCNNETELLLQILLKVFGMPIELKQEEKTFVDSLYKCINEEFNFYKKNFNK